jgi:transposase
MSKARLVITAIAVEKRTVAEVVDDYGVSRSWVYELLARYRTEGEAAFEPRSRRPHTTPRRPIRRRSSWFYGYANS